MQPSHPTGRLARRVALVVTVLVTAGAALGTAAGAAAGEPVAVNTSRGMTTAGAPLALHGYDPVAYFTDGKPIRGSEQHQHVHDGATYRFASRAHRDAFAADPDRYAPEFGGFCAYGVSVGAKFDGDPLVWKVVDDRLYLNLSPSIQEVWEKDVNGNVAKADRRWPTIRDRAPETLTAD